MVAETFPKGDVLRRRSFYFNEVFLLRYGWSSVVVYSNRSKENLGISNV